MFAVVRSYPGNRAGPKVTKVALNTCAGVRVTARAHEGRSSNNQKEPWACWHESMAVGQRNVEWPLWVESGR